MINHTISKVFITMLVCFSIGVGQYKHDLAKPVMPNREVAGQTNNSSLLDPSRFSMHHGFSMSLMSMGGKPLNMNTYTNQMTYMISDKTWIQTDIAFVLPNGSPTSLPNQSLQQNLFYRASLGYQPFENLQFNLSIERMPTYQNKPNYILNPFHRPVW
ncbi:MAG: hypothetical protein HOD97_07195 [Candidatus Marinimicrobia bacterium]|jgi:hypothetical protein|nr:hypothetical protein [Candidatus Neomarinimicrobiota bacterium]MBT3617642.1 hypothetical protein [Candidatus Neomarinimicrobiota bacterium]MBT3829084.1 hypothetical protein [Candidatus Neomarinimicrobiota bacterium]MBT3997734.1 hypothetical protein [Candidatus Neomarinimicrobiota bacterium]MBT4281379.1 hypothetical protein [Candidatus Neomarinimicrobiota bacterium]